MNRIRLGWVLLALLGIVTVILLWRAGPIAQDLAYHRFVDTRSWFSIPNFVNVFSNLLFLLVGLLGLYKTVISQELAIVAELKTVYISFFIGVGLIAIGSAYYHLHPENDTLIWDRLAIAFGFAALLTIVMGEYVSTRLAIGLYIPILLLAIGSVLYWAYTERQGAGDIRAYLLIQLFSPAAIIIFLLCFPARFSSSQPYWLLLLFYLAAKICEHFDHEIFTATQWVSGHTLKHLLAAMGIYFLLSGFEKRSVRNTRQLT